MEEYSPSLFLSLLSHVMIAWAQCTYLDKCGCKKENTGWAISDDMVRLRQS